MHPHAGQPIVHAGVPLDQSRAVAIMIHGRGATPRNILDLVPYLDVSGFSYLAPSAFNQTWYPSSFLSDIATNEPYLTSALTVLGELVADVEKNGIARERVVLLGFSQGACLASEFAVRHARRYGGVIALSGGLIGPPGTTWTSPGSFDGTPVFLGCSDVDPHIPLPRVEESAEVFGGMGAAVTTRIYPGMGHLVNDDEIACARAIMARIVE
jgi:phospholipase/carboxylesterase